VLQGTPLDQLVSEQPRTSLSVRGAGDTVSLTREDARHLTVSAATQLSHQAISANAADATPPEPMPAIVVLQSPPE